MSTVLTGVNGGSYVGTATAPAVGEPVTAASIQVVAQALLNIVAFLNADKFSTHGGTIDGLTTFTANVDINGADLLIKNGSTFTAQANTTIDIASDDVRFESGSVVDFKSGSEVTHASGSEDEYEAGSELRLFGRTRRRPRVPLSDANHTIDTTQGDCFQLSGAPGATRTITLRMTTAPLPKETERIQLIVPSSGLATATLYIVKREGSANDICWFAGVSGYATSITAELELDDGVWKLGINSGNGKDGGNPYGVLPKADVE